MVRMTAFAWLFAALPAIAEEDEETEPRGPLSNVIFSSMEAGPVKTFSSVGLKRALSGGLDTEGFRLLLKLGGAQEQLRRGQMVDQLYKGEAQALLGYEWRIGDSFVSAYAGADYEGELNLCGCSGTLRHRFGLRLQGDLWSTPTPDILIHASAYVSTLDRRIWGRIAPGWAFWQQTYLGPEIEAYRQGSYDKLRLGVHLTGLRLLGLTWRLSGGWQRTSDREGEAYVTLGLHWRR